MKKALVIGVTLACAALFVGGCSKGFNIFAPLTPAAGTLPPTPENAANAYAAGDYVAAMAMYEAVVTSEPANSSARYGYVKSYVKNAGFDIATLIQSATNSGSSAPAFFAPVSKSIVAKSYMLDSQDNPFGVNAKLMEDLSQVLITFLGPIAAGTCDGVIPANDVGLNTSLAFAYLLKGVFLVVDPDTNGTVNYNFYDDGDGNVTVVYWGTTTEVPAEAFSANKAAAADCLTNALIRLDVAITSAGASSIWTEVKNFLLEIQTEINK